MQIFLNRPSAPVSFLRRERIHPQTTEVLSGCRIAVNEEFVRLNEPVKPKKHFPDSVFQQWIKRKSMKYLQFTDNNYGEHLGRFRNPDSGAVVLFSGKVCDKNPAILLMLLPCWCNCHNCLIWPMGLGIPAIRLSFLVKYFPPMNQNLCRKLERWAGMLRILRPVLQLYN